MTEDTLTINEDDYLAHIGVIRRSGRYPWGSGSDKEMLRGNFVQVTNQLAARGYTPPQIAEGFGIKTTQLRAARSIETNRLRQEKINRAEQLKEKGYSDTAIGKAMGINESSVRSLLAPGAKDRADNLQTIAAKLKSEVDKKQFVEVGVGVENHLGISGTKLKTAVAILQEEGYVVHPAQIPQLGTAVGKHTTLKVLAPPGTTYREAKAAALSGKVHQVFDYSKDGGRSFEGEFKPPLNVDPKRIHVKYDKDGGGDADGVIHVRKGVEDLSLGGNNYAQVRIAVGGTHYLKGMAVYSDDIPKGKDLVFNTNKSSTGNHLDAMKKMKIDPDTGKVDLANPFGSQIHRQIKDDQKRVTSAMNIVNEDETWGTWSKSISTQVLSKQKPALAKQQLDMTYERRRNELDEIKRLTNPTVRRKLLEAYADSTDSAAVHLQAAHLPRQATHVILPVMSLKEHEVYAPKFHNGETVVLIRYPHGGKFEIPELTVNNRNKEARDNLGNAQTAVGIHPKVAKRLSGADFDGDTVVVIPNSRNNPRRIENEPPLAGLKNFDPQHSFPPYHGMKTIDGGNWNAHTKEVEFESGKKPNSRHKGTQMGMVSNLITDMTIKGAPHEELARAVKHSMVVIDAEKHSLDYKASAQRHGIRELTTKYQGNRAGASTLISRATSKVTVDATSPRPARDGGPIDPKTGRLVMVPKEGYVDRDGVYRTPKVKVDKLANTHDARTLISTENTVIENVYADHSNRLKGLANEARREVAAFKPPLINKSAKDAYKEEVKSLNHALNVARANKPLERQAQIIALAQVNQRLEANPLMDPADIKKIKNQALATARIRTGASKTKIRPTPEEWAAIQAGAISQNQLKQILDNADLDHIKELATPRNRVLMTGTKKARAEALLASDYTLAEVASQLGVSTSTLTASLK